MAVPCVVCQQSFKIVNNAHLATHNLTPKQYLERYPDAQCYSEEAQQAIVSNAKKRFSDPRHHPMFGKHQTIKTRKAIGANTTRCQMGRKRSDSWRKNISTALLGHAFSDETRKKMSLNHADITGSNNPFYGRQHTSETKTYLSGVRALHVMPMRDTEPEQIVQNMLRQLNIPFKTHVPVLLDRRSTIGVGFKRYHQIDIVLKSPNIIEVEGCYWHQCELCGFNKGRNGFSADEIREHDKLRDYLLELKGFVVHRIWEHELKQNSEGVIRRILDWACVHGVLRRPKCDYERKR